MPGDIVRIVSTARKISKNEVSFAKKKLEEWGLLVEYGQHLFDVQDQFAGSDKARAYDLQNALDNEQVKAIVFARGGYGTVRVIDKIDFSKFKASPKWLAGYSDITVLHEHIHSNFEIQTLHSSMPINFEGNSLISLETLRRSLFGETYNIESPFSDLNREGMCSGEVIGGNLSIIYSLIGSPSDIDTKGKILFLEDLDEYLYHVDRMMQNLLRTGKLNDLAGMVIGGLSDMNDNETPYGKKAPQIIWEAVSKFHYPVCYDFPAGHQKDNRCVIFGRKATLNVTKQKTILEY